MPNELRKTNVPRSLIGVGSNVAGSAGVWKPRGLRAAQQPDRRQASWSWFGVFLCVASRVQSSEAELTTATSLHGLWRIGERTSLKQKWAYFAHLNRPSELHTKAHSRRRSASCSSAMFFFFMNHHGAFRDRVS